MIELINSKYRRAEYCGFVPQYSYGISQIGNLGEAVANAECASKAIGLYAIVLERFLLLVYVILIEYAFR